MLLVLLHLGRILSLIGALLLVNLSVNNITIHLLIFQERFDLKLQILDLLAELVNLFIFLL